MLKKILKHSEKTLDVNGGQNMISEQKKLQILDDYINGELPLGEQTKIIGRLITDPELREIYNPRKFLKDEMPKLGATHLPYTFTVEELLRSNNLIP